MFKLFLGLLKVFKAYDTIDCNFCICGGTQYWFFGGTILIYAIKQLIVLRADSAQNLQSEFSVFDSVPHYPNSRHNFRKNKENLAYT